MGTPQSTIYITDVPLNSSYEHTYYFKSKEDQYSFFWSHRVKTFTNYTYCRKNWDLKVEATLEDANKWRYLFFQNGSSGKLYYYFITQVQYVNDCTVNLSLEMDVIQTYLFDMVLNPSYIERQHTETDNLFEHTLDEGLETGELVNGNVFNIEVIKHMCVLILSTINLADTYANGTFNANHGKIMDGVYSGLGVYAVKDEGVLSSLLNMLDGAGKTGSIVAMWMYPLACFDVEDFEEYGVMEVTGTGLSECTVGWYYSYSHNQGYEPRNKKLYCYPFNFLYATNNAGSSAVYRYEHMEAVDGMYKFHLKGAISPDATVRIYPQKYDGNSDAYELGLNTAPYPSVAWDSDVYKVWLAQNQNVHDFTTKQAMITAGAGALTSLGSVAFGNVTGAMGGLATAYHGYSQIEQLNAQKKDMAIQPPQASGNFSANVNIASGRHTFTFMWKTLRPEYAKIIDNYFDRYGYKLNRVAIPNLCARKNYTYIKTVSCHVSGQLCSEDINKIASVFDNGVTFWNVSNNTSCTFGYYTENPTL